MYDNNYISPTNHNNQVFEKMHYNNQNNEFFEFKSSINKTNILCIGAGYIGVPLMAVLASNCPEFMFYVVDRDVNKISNFNNNKIPFYEPGLEEKLKQTQNKNLLFSSDCEKHIKICDIIFLCVNTSTSGPQGSGYTQSLKPIEDAAKSIAQASNSHKIIIEKSTVPATTADAIMTILKKFSNYNFCVISNPEFTAEGSTINDLTNPDRVVIGGSNDDIGQFSTNVLSSLYQHWIPKEKILNIDTNSSELCKLVANAMLSQRLSSINSISSLCEVIGADINKVLSAVGSDKRIGRQYLSPSLGFGGSCFKKDLEILIYVLKKFKLDEVAIYWQGVLDMNNFRKNTFIQNIINAFDNNLKEIKIAMFGIAFKKNTSDVRESAAIQVCKQLMDRGSIIEVYDPNVNREQAIQEILIQYNHSTEVLNTKLIFNMDPYACANNSNAIVITTDEEEFKSLDYEYIFKNMKKPAFIFDGRNIIEKTEVYNIGFNVFSIGTPPLLQEYKNNFM